MRPKEVFGDFAEGFCGRSYSDILPIHVDICRCRVRLKTHVGPLLLSLEVIPYPSGLC